MATIQRLHPAARYSEAAIHDGTVYLAGQVADDATQDIVGQTRQVLATIDRLLGEAGSDKTRILRAQVYLADIADFDGMNTPGTRGCPPAPRRRGRRSRPGWPVPNGGSKW